MTANDHANDDRQIEADENESFPSVALVAPSVVLGPLQTVTVDGIQARTTVVELALVALLLAVGSLITYQAFRGYRRNDDADMALFAIGLFLLTVVHAVLKLALAFVVPVLLGDGQTMGYAVAATSQAVDVVGLVVVFYAIVR